MKRIVTTLFIAAATIVLMAGCKGKDSVVNDPKAVLVAFFEKMSQKDIDGAAKLATKGSKGTMEMMKKGMDMAEGMKDKMGTDVKEKDPAEDFKQMVFGEAKIDGDNATVAVTNPAKDNKTFDFPLKKEDGSWKVDFNMGTLMKMGMKESGKNNPLDDMNKDNTDTTGMTDKIEKYMNSDSLKEAMGKLDSLMKNIDPEKMKHLKDAMKDLEKMKEN